MKWIRDKVIERGDNMIVDLRDIFRDENQFLGQEVTVQGWIRNHRKQKEFGFIDFSDGTCFEHLQIVYDNTLPNFEEITKIHIGSAVSVTGILASSPKEGQTVELQLQSFTLEGDAPEDYPIQPKRHTREFLREVAYLRPRTNLFQAVFRVRSVAACSYYYSK